MKSRPAQQLPADPKEPRFFTPGLAITLSESAAPDKVQLLRCGSFEHPEHGTLDITPELLEELVANFQKDVRGVELSIDYAHRTEDKAAAWIRDVFIVDGDELWARVQWTKGGRAAVEGGDFRYISADFGFEYTDAETQQRFGPTLNGAALTNRPFIKRMAPVVQLSETTTTENDEMKLEEAQKKITELETANKKLSEDMAALNDRVSQGAGLQAKCDELLSERDQLKKQLSDLQTELAELKKKSADAAVQAAEAKKKAEFDAKLAEGKVCEAQRAAWMKGDMEEFVRLSEPVKLKREGSGEGGGSGAGGSEPKTKAEAEKEIDTKARVLLSEKKVATYGEGVQHVLRENPKLAEKYREVTA